MTYADVWTRDVTYLAHAQQRVLTANQYTFERTQSIFGINCIYLNYPIPRLPSGNIIPWHRAPLNGWFKLNSTEILLKTAKSWWNLVKPFIFDTSQCIWTACQRNSGQTDCNYNCKVSKKPWPTEPQSFSIKRFWCFNCGLWCLRWDIFVRVINGSK